MNGYDYLAYFFAGAFFTNAIPHIVHGVSGKPFQSPFAKPPGKGLSSSTVNVLWGAFNLALAYLLIFHVGAFDPRDCADVISISSGALVTGLFSARNFGKLHGGNL